MSSTPLLKPKPGDVVIIGAEASVQFAGDRGFYFRVATVRKEPTYDGWVWMTGYVIDMQGTALENREIFVQQAGLRWSVIRPKSKAARRAGGTR